MEQDGPPSKHRTKEKSSQSATTATNYVQASTQLTDSIVKIQRKGITTRTTPMAKLIEQLQLNLVQSLCQNANKMDLPPSTEPK